MKLKVMLFARLKELAGQETIEIDVDPESKIGDLWKLLCDRYPKLKTAESNVLFSQNQEFAGPQAELHEGDEVAVFPPVSGGCGDSEPVLRANADGNVIQIIRSPIPFEPLIAQLSRPEDGAVVVFSGIVRDNTGGRKTRFLEYEAYVPMALRKMYEIGQALKQKWNIDRVGMVHRLGRLEIGEASIVIVVTSSHRKDAFAACQYAIDTLKSIVPIWKKEHYDDGEVWVG